MISKATAMVIVNDQAVARKLDTAAIRSQLIRMGLRPVRLNPKLLKRCGCSATAPDELGGFGSCLKGCLADAGASPLSIIMCSATCVFGAVPLCAICVGLSVTVVEVCALGCLAYPDGMKGPGILMHNHLTPGKLKHAATQAALAVPGTGPGS